MFVTEQKASLGMLALAWNPSVAETEAGGPGVQGHPEPV